MINKIFLCGVICFIIGLGMGYVISKERVVENNSGTHMMADGHVMNDDEMTMEEMMISMNAELKGKTGDAFDQSFLTEMIVHHEGAVEMAELALTSAKHQEIKDLANAIIVAQKREISDMKEWLANWYNLR